MAFTYNFVGTLSVNVGDTLTQTGNAGSQRSTYNPGSGPLPQLKSNFKNGTGANAATRMWRDLRTVAAGTNDDLNLNGGAIVDDFGRTLAFTNVKRVIIQVKGPVTGGKLVIGNAGTPAQLWFTNATDTQNVYGLHIWENPIDGWTIGNNATLRIANQTAASITYQIEIIG